MQQLSFRRLLSLYQNLRLSFQLLSKDAMKANHNYTRYGIFLKDISTMLFNVHIKACIQTLLHKHSFHTYFWFS